MSDGLTALGHASSWIINLEHALSQAEKELSVERAAREAAEQMLAEISSILEVSPGEDIVKVVRTTDRELTRWEKTGQDALTQLAEKDQQIAALTRNVQRIISYMEDAPELWGNPAADAVVIRLRALLAPPATDQQQPADDWSDTLPDSARRERRRTVQQPGDMAP